MGNTDLRDVQYGKIRTNCAILVQYATVFYAIWECRFLIQNDADLPHKHPKRAQFFPNIISVIIYYVIALEAHRKAVVGAEIA